MYYDEVPYNDPNNLGGLKKLVKKAVKVVKKVALPVAAIVAAPVTGGASIAAYGALSSAKVAKATNKANIAQTNAMITGGVVPTKAQAKILKEAADHDAWMAKNANGKALKPSEIAKNQKLHAQVDAINGASASKVASLAVGSSGTAVEIAVANSSPKLDPATIAPSVSVLPGPDPLAPVATDSKKDRKGKEAARKERAKLAQARLAALQSGSSGATAEAAALAAKTGTTTEDALKQLIAQAQASAASGGAPVSSGGGGGGGFAPTQDSTANMLEKDGGNTAAPAPNNTLKYGLIAGGVAALIYAATRKK